MYLSLKLVLKKRKKKENKIGKPWSLRWLHYPPMFFLPKSALGCTWAMKRGWESCTRNWSNWTCSWDWYVWSSSLGEYWTKSELQVFIKSFQKNWRAKKGTQTLLQVWDQFHLRNFCSFKCSCRAIKILRREGL